MWNRHQLTSGESGAPRSEGSAERTAPRELPGLQCRALTVGPPTRGRVECITIIGQAGRPGRISP